MIKCGKFSNFKGSKWYCIASWCFVNQLGPIVFVIFIFKQVFKNEGWTLYLYFIYCQYRSDLYNQKCI